MPAAVLRPPLRRFVASVLPETTQPRPIRRTLVGRVVELVGSEGRRWFLKQYRHLGHFDAEVAAYRNWVPTIQHRAPALVAADRAVRAVLVTGISGAPLQDLRAHRFVDAGRLLRMFHGSVPAREASVAGRVRARLEGELSRCRRFGIPVDEAWFRGRIAIVDDLDPLPVVPCHGDYLPQNWLVDSKGTLRVIDFADAQLHAAAFDLSRLQFGVGWDRPNRVAAFLHGYGRPLQDVELAFVDAHLPVNALAALSWGTRNDVDSVRQQGHVVLAALRDGWRFQPSAWRGRAVALRRRIRVVGTG